ncbi:MAG: hypothetical protein N3A38_16780, partial [Planctomycetota bacterium]|nr:hypothetical protein [Planctomycetota bacterium]
MKTMLFAAQQVLRTHPKDLLDAIRGEITLAAVPADVGTTDAAAGARAGGGGDGDAGGAGGAEAAGGKAGAGGIADSGTPVPVLVLGMYAGDQAEPLSVSLDGMIGTFVMMTGGTFRYTSYPFAGRTVRVLVAPEDSAAPETAFSVADGFLVSAAGPGRSARKTVETLLSNMKRNDETGQLRSNALFRRAMERPEGGAPDAAIYADIGRLESILTPAATDALKRRLGMAGAGGVRGIAWSLRIEGGMLREMLRLEAKERKGILALASDVPLEGAPFRDVPADAVAAVAFRFDPRSACDAVLAFFDAIGTDAGRRIGAGIADAEKASNVDFRRDVLEALFSGEATIAASLDGAAGAPLPLRLIPRLAIRAGVRDPGKAREALAAASRFAAAWGVKSRELNLA